MEHCYGKHMARASKQVTAEVGKSRQQEVARLEVPVLWSEWQKMFRSLPYSRPSRRCSKAVSSLASGPRADSLPWFDSPLVQGASRPRYTDKAQMQRPGHTGRKALATKKLPYSRPFFFLRLPIGQYGPVSQLSRSEERCTGPFNWGEAHCAGEKVKRKIGPFLRKSLKNQTRTRTQQKGAQPATATRNPLARLPGARAKEETNPTNKRLHQQILVRLNVLDLQWTIL